MDVAWPGSTQDARIWNRSKVKLLRVVEETKNYYIAGDIGYLSLSYVRKRIRKVDKKSFLGIKKPRARMRLESSQKIIVVSAILYNILRLWGEEDNEEGESDDNNCSEQSVRDEARDTIRIRAWPGGKRQDEGLDAIKITC